MSALFPDPYPDELLYSALARYQDMMGITAGRAVLRTFFGTETGRAVFDLPGRLDALLSCLPPNHQYTPERLLYDHTLLPYYVPFLPPERVDRGERRMRRGDGNTIHGILGLRSSRIPLTEPFRFCSDCVEGDRESFGVAYWHRAHQLPGTWICATHGSVLQEYRTLLPYPPYDFISLERLLHRDFDTAPAIDSKEKQRELQLLAEETSLLLRTRMSPPGLTTLHKRYHYFLNQNGWMQTAKCIRMSDLRRAFRRYFGVPLLQKLGCALPLERDGWIERLLRKPRSASHPLHHLLVLQFLGIPVADFLVQMAPTESCSASAKCERDPTVETPPSARKTHNAKWENRLVDLVDHSDCSLRSIAHTLKVDPRTVQRHARRLGVWRDEWTTWDQVAPSQKRKNETLKRRAQYRTQWISLQEEHPKDGITALRKRAPATYAFLYRIDREWLKANSPSDPVPRTQIARVDWLKRDREFHRQATEVVETLHQAPGRPVWIRRSTVLKRMGRTSEFFSNRDHLPKTRAFLGEISETRVDFARKKIDWAMLDCISRNICPKPWELIRQAALRPDLASCLGNEITQAASKIKATLRTHID